MPLRKLRLPAFLPLLLLAAAASAIGAALRLEHPLAPVFTRWDETLILALLSLSLIHI